MMMMMMAVIVQDADNVGLLARYHICSSAADVTSLSGYSGSSDELPRCH